MWWKHVGGSLEKDLKPFRNDEDASFLSLFAEKNECEAKTYTEAKPFTNIGEEGMHDFDEEFDEGFEVLDEGDVDGRDDVDGCNRGNLL
ncbi:hypothetical protein KIW84_042971 [Lathyrus oleraceus]|uniref:Uncharacterized protein n=1 Tax=Pisum sativum TaxID=3888 RepID=A0A9D4XCJ2_PEA|nr:hypothetical protein KIW84_042971 [Pisum sativum]